jgi:hypothetical protein
VVVAEAPDEEMIFLLLCDARMAGIGPAKTIPDVRFSADFPTSQSGFLPPTKGQLRRDQKSRPWRA